MISTRVNLLLYPNIPWVIYLGKWTLLSLGEG